MEMVIVILSFLLGVCVEAVITNIILALTQASGTLKIDNSDPEKDLYRFEIDNLDGLSNKTKVVLKIEHVTDLSQE